MVAYVISCVVKTHTANHAEICLSQESNFSGTACPEVNQEKGIEISSNSLQRQLLHPLKWALGVVDLLRAQNVKETISHEFNVLSHQFAVHANERYLQHKDTEED